MSDVILNIKNLSVEFALHLGRLQAVSDLSLTLHKKQIIGLVGESGSGKSITCRAILGLLPDICTANGKIDYYQNDHKTDLVQLLPNSKQLRQIRGREIAMIFQEPFAALSPVYRIGKQMVEALRAHKKISYKQAKLNCLDMLDMVGMPRPQHQFNQYPHQMSGGLLQRVIIAMALLHKPGILLADEPTTALDVTTQTQILQLLKSLYEEMDMSVLYISHNLDVITAISDIVFVMYLGRIVERGTASQIFSNPGHPYTQGLIDSIPRFGKKTLKAMAGHIPVPINLPQACAFSDRCPAFIKGRCDENIPKETEIESGHFVRCRLYD